MIHIVLLGGGSGISNLLKTFRNDPELRISAIISTSDSGGSTGVLRKTYTVPALGDIRKNLSALTGETGVWTEYRFQHGFLDEHPVGNIWLLGLVEQYGFSEGLDRAHDILGTGNHRIIPATEDIHDILVTLTNGERLLGEDTIISRTDLSHQIDTLELTPKTSASSSALEALQSADIILVGPGTFYTSLLPCLLPAGMFSTLQSSKAKKVFIANAANFPVGHCEGYDVDIYLSEMRRLIGDITFDRILIHDAEGVDYQKSVAPGQVDNRKIIDTLLLPNTEVVRQGKFDSIPRNTLKHDAHKVLHIIKSLVQ